jgi:thymidine kinase
MLINTGNSGWVEAITGCMGSGKTEELTRRVRRSRLAGRRVAVFGFQFPDEEDLNAPDEEIHFSDEEMRIQPVRSSEHLAASIPPAAEVVAVVDAQFFDKGLSDVLRGFADHGMQVIVAGLDMDFLGQGFGPMPEILAQAEEVLKLYAGCACGSSATRSQRLIDGKPATAQSALMGSRREWKYEPRCRACHLVPTEPK